MRLSLSVNSLSPTNPVGQVRLVVRQRRLAASPFSSFGELCRRPELGLRDLRKGFGTLMGQPLVSTTFTKQIFMSAWKLASHVSF
jgi:hypothetical protein